MDSKQEARTGRWETGRGGGDCTHDDEPIQHFIRWTKTDEDAPKTNYGMMIIVRSRHNDAQQRVEWKPLNTGRMCSRQTTKKMTEKDKKNTPSP